MPRNGDHTIPAEGLRARKRRETLQRITDAGMRLFIEHGYDRTTLDEIAAAAGISRRTFFYYFKSKDDILLSLQNGMGEMIAAAVRDGPKDRRPLHLVRDAVIKICAAIPAAHMIAIDRLMRASEAVQARKQASYVQHERTLFEALRSRWPEPQREIGLKLVAMMSIGAIRLSTDTFSQENGRRSFAAILRESFDALEAVV